MFDNLYAQAAVEMKNWMARQVPPFLMDHYDYFVGEAPPPGLQPNQTVVTHGQSVRMVTNTGVDLPGSPGLCVVGAGTLNGAQLGSAPQWAVVNNGQSIPLVYSNLTAHPESPVLATISASTLQNVRTQSPPPTEQPPP